MVSMPFNFLMQVALSRIYCHSEHISNSWYRDHMDAETGKLVPCCSIKSDSRLSLMHTGITKSQTRNRSSTNEMRKNISFIAYFCSPQFSRLFLDILDHRHLKRNEIRGLPFIYRDQRTKTNINYRKQHYCFSKYFLCTFACV